jgi:alpha-beta hydrolase superfamily lysophospholipase
LTDLLDNFVFSFEDDFEEFTIPATDQATLSGLLFKADSAKGVIFYLYGNAGALDTWGGVANTYISRGYDIFLLDYRQYHKSTGKISREAQFFDDVQHAYNLVKTKYSEKDIIVLGYSLGTGPASFIAADYLGT